MEELDFAGHVAVVTGAGRGIGEEYARLLAARGARVIVNDLGVEVTGEGGNTAVATAVAEEIQRDGGTAEPNFADISTPEGGASLIRQALDSFGRCDIVIHNAGTVIHAPFEQQDMAGVAKVIATHLLGAFYVVQPAWRQMLDQRYGRVLLTSSVGLFGAPDLSSYSAVKGGCVSLARTLSLEAARAGVDIKVNVIAPTAHSRMARFAHANDDRNAATDLAFGERMHPRNVAAVALPLVHELCPVSGECIKAGGGSVSRIFTAMTRGWTSPDSTITPEQVFEHLSAAMDERDYHRPESSATAREIVLASKND